MDSYTTIYCWMVTIVFSNWLKSLPNCVIILFDGWGLGKPCILCELCRQATLPSTHMVNEYNYMYLDFKCGYIEIMACDIINVSGVWTWKMLLWFDDLKSEELWLGCGKIPHIAIWWEMGPNMLATFQFLVGEGYITSQSMSNRCFCLEREWDRGSFIELFSIWKFSCNF